MTGLCPPQPVFTMLFSQHNAFFFLLKHQCSGVIYHTPPSSIPTDCSVMGAHTTSGNHGLFTAGFVLFRFAIRSVHGHLSIKFITGNCVKCSRLSAV
ncbi:hypothetical protein VTK56DRAFT_5751 [Thermocarpiscus australiensis]